VNEQARTLRDVRDELREALLRVEQGVEIEERIENSGPLKEWALSGLFLPAAL